MLCYTILFLCVLFLKDSGSPVKPHNSNITAPSVISLPDLSPLFEKEDHLDIQLSGNIRALMNDRGNNPKRHSLTLTYRNEDSSTYTLNIEAKTRGNFRRTLGNCRYPPIMLYFREGDTLSASLFRGQKKLKLVVPCRSDDFVVREWLAYKIYNLVTPESFKVRLVRITLTENKNKKSSEPFYAMLLEDEDEMAARNKASILKKQMLRPEQTQTSSFHTMAVFQFLIANTDWSVQYLQNIRLLNKDSLTSPATVPYDFDMSGWVDAPYGKPADALKLPSVRFRRYRGYCVSDMKIFEPALQMYRSVRPQINDLISNCPYLTPESRKSRIQFLNSFYAIIDNPEKLKNEFLYPCDKNGTGNVIIGGLQSSQDQ